MQYLFIFSIDSTVCHLYINAHCFQLLHAICEIVDNGYEYIALLPLPFQFYTCISDFSIFKQTNEEKKSFLFGFRVCESSKK